jgi:putative ABC transport system substrate-binding protein
MRRREFVAMTAGALAASLVHAQQPGRVYRLGVMGFGEREAVRRSFELLLPALAQAGFIEGRNLVVDLHVAASESQPLEALAAQLAAENFDALFVASHPGAAAVKRATTRIPIVALLGSDPVAAGLVASLARPGGNLTGVTLLAIETGNKRLEVVKEIFPATRRVYWLTQRVNAHFVDEAKPHAARIGITVEPLLLENLREMEAFFAKPLGRDESIIVATTQVNFVNRAAIAALANRARAQAVYSFLESAEAGGLVAYAGDIRDAMVRTMRILARILKGANPAELPFEQATRVSMVINLKTARALGFTFPQAVLLRADRVIE